MDWENPGARVGHTSIWIGSPPFIGDIDFLSTKAYSKGKKVTSFIMSPTIPEYTQFNVTEGEIIARGWRDILRKFVMCHAATKERVEQVFKVTLDYEGTDGTCGACRKTGLISKAEGMAGLCAEHTWAIMDLEEQHLEQQYAMNQLLVNGDTQVGGSHDPKIGEGLWHSSHSTDQKHQQKGQEKMLSKANDTLGLKNGNSAQAPRSGSSLTRTTNSGGI